METDRQRINEAKGQAESGRRYPFNPDTTSGSRSLFTMVLDAGDGGWTARKSAEPHSDICTLFVPFCQWPLSRFSGI
jgi:hypothetical protein